MSYQLVLQFSAFSVTDYDKIIMIEEELIETLRDTVDIDGHDAGVGEINIFIWTDDPTGIFVIINKVPSMQPFLARLKAGYRSADSEVYTPIYPLDLAHFSVA